MASNEFFDISREQSKVKAIIVSKYFMAWSKVMMAVQDRSKIESVKKIGYIDLFAGPGRYSDGTASTPIKILEKVIDDEKLKKRLVCVFNDKDLDRIQSLQAEINKLLTTSSLHYKPIFYNKEIGTEIVELFEQMKITPTFFFVDPWGYKGLSLKLINAVIKDWGCECVFFFNYNRINMGINNQLVEEHMNALFGKERVDILRNRISTISGEQRELTIVEELCQAIKKMNQKYVLPFRFKSEDGNRTSHHLIFVTKHFKGYEIMKEVMYKESSEIDQGVASFEYNPASKQQPFLFSLTQPLEDLEGLLLKHFAGQSMTMREIYEQHNVDTPYISKNYKHALTNLEKLGKILTHPSNRKRGFNDDVMVSFP